KTTAKINAKINMKKTTAKVNAKINMKKIMAEIKLSFTRKTMLKINVDAVKVTTIKLFDSNSNYL
ncbi:hypothetical protein CBE79_27400, partial [Priestia megaterium]